MKLSSKVAVPLCIPTSNEWGFPLFHILTVFSVVSVLDFVHSNRCALIFHCCFTLHFPNNTWYGASFHMCLFAICISFLMRYLFRSLAHFLTRLFSYCCGLKLLCLFWVIVFPLSDVSLANIVSHSVASLLILCLSCNSFFFFFILMKSSLIILSFMDLPFGAISKKS